MHVLPGAGSAIPEGASRGCVAETLPRAGRGRQTDGGVLLGLVKIDPRVWVSIERRHETPTPPVAVVGARRVFRLGCAHGAPGRSVRSCTGSPSPERRPRLSRSPGSVVGPRTPPGRSEDRKSTRLN